MKSTLPAFSSVDWDLGLIYQKCKEKFWPNCQNNSEIDEVRSIFFTQFITSPI